MFNIIIIVLAQVNFEKRITNANIQTKYIPRKSNQSKL